MPSLLVVTLSTAMSVLFLAIYAPFFSKDFEVSFDPLVGAFGYFYSSEFLYVVFVLGFFTGACTFASYGLVLEYFSPLVLCTAFLFEPLIAQLLSCMLNLDKIPGVLTFLGSFISLAGLLFVTQGGFKMQQQ